jgi:hypothetical protein
MAIALKIAEVLGYDHSAVAELLFEAERGILDAVANSDKSRDELADHGINDFSKVP